MSDNRAFYIDLQNQQDRKERQRTDRLRSNAVYNASIQNLHGQAVLYSVGPDRLASIFRPQGDGLLPLGSNQRGSTDGLTWSVTQQQGHAITFGATRSGKGVCSIIPALLSYGGSMVVIDPKGENAWCTAARRGAPADVGGMGQRIVILDPWNEVNRRYASKFGVTDRITKFNPLSAIDPKSPDFADDVAAVADALVFTSTPGGADSHWVNSARELVSGLVAAVIENNPGKASLRQVRRLLTAPDEELSEAINILFERDPDSLAGRKLRRFTKLTAEISGIRSTAETQTSILDSETLLDAMETDETPFDLAELGGQKYYVTLYLVLPLDRLDTHGRWLRLLLTMAIRTIARQDTPPPAPVLFMLDEMGTVGPLRMIEQAYELMAGIGVRIWAFLQDINQLKRDYPLSWETFISNSSVIQALKVTDATTSEYLSKLLGSRTIERISLETAQARAGKLLSAGDPNASKMSDQVMERLLLLPQEIRALPPNQLLNIMPGRGNYLVQRVAYYDRDEWIDNYRPMPGFKMKERPAPVVPSAPAPPIVDMDKVKDLAGKAGAAGAVLAGKAGAAAGAWLSKVTKPQEPPDKV